MELMNFPFIVQYIRSYKDTNCLYFLTEYVKGIELFEVIRTMGLLNTYDAQFYTASMILCLEFLYNQNVIHRDIKPENIMVDQNVLSSSGSS